MKQPQPGEKKSSPPLLTITNFLTYEFVEQMCAHFISHLQLIDLRDREEVI